MFNLPPSISYQKEQLSNGFAFNFRHTKLGSLGRILLQEFTNGQTKIVCEVIGDSNDPMTAKRAAIFEPIGMEISRQLEAALENKAQPINKEDLTPTYQSSTPIETIPSKLIPCPKCGADSALLIFADHAQDIGGMEDYARLMYAKIMELDVPTWVIAPPVGTDAANILKIHPQREPVCKLTDDEFNQKLDRIIASHKCLKSN